MRSPVGRGARSVAAAAAAVLAAAAFTAGSAAGTWGQPAGSPAATADRPASADRATRPAVVVEGPGLPPSAPESLLEVRYRLEVRTARLDAGRAASLVESTLSDPRGWSRAGFRLVRDDAAAPFLVVLAEPEEVDRLCAPYRTAGRWSCQNGPVVALNADRWREASPRWTGDLVTYRQMLVNHEVGHLLGLHHPPSPQCPVPGRPALAMSQQSSELDGCLPNPWPLEQEVALARQRAEPLAPPYEP